MYKCSKVSCSDPPTFSCICRDEQKYFCQTDLLSHLGDTAVKHDPKPMAAKINSSVISLVLASLSTLKSEIQQKKKQILDDFSRSITLLEERGRKAIRDMSDYEKSLDKAIADIKSNPEALDNNNLKKTLTLSLDQAKEECKDWKLVKVYMNSEDLRSSIKEWSRIDNDLEYLFTNKQRSGKSEEKTFERQASVSDYPKAHQCREEVKRQRSATVVEAPNAYPAEKPPKEDFRQPPPQPAPPNPSESARKSMEVPRPQDLQRSSSMKPLRCSRNHDLKWSVTTPFAYYKKSNSFWIECDNCHTTYSKSGWNCLECSYDLCEGCGLNAGAGCPKLKCNNNHELLWKSDACMYYELKGKGHNFVCKRCGARKDETHWHCRQCEFDVCQSCGSEQNYAPIIPRTACPNSHPLQEETRNAVAIGNLMIGMQCKSCKKNFAGKCYTCEPCSYVICAECYDFLKRPAAGHPVFRCQATHLLRWARTEEFICDYCSQKKTQERYRCKECNFDVCAECSNVLLNLILTNTSKTHGPENHPLVWNPNPSMRTGGNPVPCNACGVGFRKAGMFSCKRCSNNYCVLCYDNPNRPKPQQSAGVDQNLLALQLLAGLLRTN